MNEDEIEYLRKQLLCLKSKLEEEEEAVEGNKETVELDQAKVGRLSRMDAMQQQQMALEESRRRQNQLLKIGGALHRIEKSDYGYCFICEEEIDIRRLSFDPTYTRCVKCMEETS